ncbi:MAG TPA: hypothetical protein DEA43_00285 [Candidatus Moranbacteria bacterium]|nr:hypothetical protein [Candidatus Moranbacteria bacterium]HBT45309.1 hypothetical protein [Candidatus Moranbacteria bacterium]
MLATNKQILEISNSIIILDIDGTIVSDSEYHIEEDILELISDLKKENTLYLCSNSKDSKRNTKIAEILNVPLINSPHKKPNKAIIDYINNEEKKNIIVIGDKFLTDGIFSKNINAKFIKVRRISNQKERFIIKLINIIDDIAYAIWKMM